MCKKTNNVDWLFILEVSYGCFSKLYIECYIEN